MGDLKLLFLGIFFMVYGLYLMLNSDKNRVKKFLGNLAVYSVFMLCLMGVLASLIACITVSPLWFIHKLYCKLKGKREVFWEVTRKSGSGSKYLHNEHHLSHLTRTE
ncbi:MAG: hypothetical protein QXU45_01895 [Candidatus Bathyarchaeia archaeon]